MLSRVAERLYWMARYLERVENTARLVGVFGELQLDLPEETGLDWSLPLTMLGQKEAFKAASGDEDELHFLLSSQDNPASLLNALRSARENARTTRDLVPTEAWRTINELYLNSRKRLKEMANRPSSGYGADIIDRCHTITGILDGTMSHGAAFQFVRLGRSLERADMTSRMIEVAAAIMMTGREELRHQDNSVWRAILRALSAYQAYRQYMRRRIAGPQVVAFLLLDELFPRAVMHCVQVLDTAVSQLPRSETARAGIAALKARLESVDVENLDHPAVKRYVDDLQRDFASIGGIVFDTWLNPMRITQVQ